MINRSWQRHTIALLVAPLVATMLFSCKQGTDKSKDQREIPPRNAEARYDGIDISSHQGKIDWEKVSSDKDIRFVYIKATEGSTYCSPHYPDNITEARSSGLLVGSYHYLTTTSPIDRQFKCDPPADHLSPRQIDILKGIVAGKSNTEIANLLGISPTVVRDHTTIIFEKLGVSNRVEAVAAALRKQLLKI